MTTQVLTGDCIDGAGEAIKLASQHDGLYATVGCHPCRASEWEAAELRGEDHSAQLEELIAKGGDKVVAGQSLFRSHHRARPRDASS